MNLAALALIVSAQADPAFGRFDSWLKSAGSFSVEYKVALPQGRIGAGKLWIGSAPNSRVEYTDPYGKYVFIASKTGIVEYETQRKTYRTYPPFTTWVEPPNSLEFGPAAIVPTMLFSRSASRLAPGSVKWVSSGTSPTTLTTSFETEIGVVNLKLQIDAQGKLVGFNRVVSAGPAAESVSITLSNYQIKQSFSASSFIPNPPIGYQMTQLPREQSAIPVGSKLPVDGWKDAQGKQFRLGGGKNRMVVVMGAEGCAPTKGLISFLESESKALGLNGFTWILVGAESSIVQGGSKWTSIKTSSGEGFSRLGSDRTPILFLTESDGTVLAVWQGFHASMKSAFRKEIPAALKEAN